MRAEERSVACSITGDSFGFADDGQSDVSDVQYWSRRGIGEEFVHRNTLSVSQR